MGLGFWSRLFGKKPAAAASSSDNFGYSASEPVLCCLPPGERAYLDRLRCPAGHRFRYQRIGSMQGKCPDPAWHADAFPDEQVFQAELKKMPIANAPADLPCMIDCYQLVCEGGEHQCTVYMDMYHPRTVDQPAPKGLRLE